MHLSNCILSVYSVKEEVFWRNYFYRVSLIKQSAQLTALAAQQQAVRKEKGGGEDSRELTGRDFIFTNILLCWMTTPFADLLFKGLLLEFQKSEPLKYKIIVIFHNINSYKLFCYKKSVCLSRNCATKDTTCGNKVAAKTS